MKKRYAIVIVLVAAAILAVFGVLVYQYFQSRESVKVAEAVRLERQRWKEKTAELENEVAALEHEITQQLQTAVPEARVAEAFGKPVAQADAVPIVPNGDCREIENRIRSFFEYLDKRDYFRKSGWKGGAYALFRDGTERLTVHRPLVAEETRDLLGLLRNVAHFFRALGKERVLLLREILHRESDILEPAMASFYAWHQAKQRCRMELEGMPDLPVLYNYAGFFLQTLGGRSYLARRDPVVRMTATYYAILILDEANRAKINVDGIDIRPLIEILRRDMAGQKNLAYRTHYLETLERLAKKYRR